MLETLAEPAGGHPRRRAQRYSRPIDGSILPLVAGLMLLGAAWWASRRRMRVADTPRSRCAAVFVGFNNVQGRVGDVTPSPAHYTGTIAAWWRATLEHEWEVTVEVVDKDADGRERRRLQTHYEFRLSESWASGPAIWIVDETGRVLVDTTNASVEAALLHSLVGGVRMPGIGAMAGPGSRPTGVHREQEWRLHDGDAVFCLGHARIDDTGSGVVIDGSGGEEFLVTVRPPTAVTRRRRVGTWLLLILGVGLPVALPPAATPRAVLAGALAVLCIGWGVVVAYNRLVRIRHLQQRAWSLIDVQLSRRATLIPQLAAAAAGYAEHESALHEAVTCARANGAAAWLALREQYPQLDADTVFAAVAAELAATETQIAAAREYFNDAVTTLRDRTSTFPGILLAKVASTGRFGAMDLIAAGDEERDAPELRRLLARD